MSRLIKGELAQRSERAIIQSVTADESNQIGWVDEGPWAMWSYILRGLLAKLHSPIREWKDWETERRVWECRYDGASTGNNLISKPNSGKVFLPWRGVDEIHEPVERRQNLDELSQRGWVGNKLSPGQLAKSSECWQLAKKDESHSLVRGLRESSVSLVASREGNSLYWDKLTKSKERLGLSPRQMLLLYWPLAARA